jgi:hypothetical protein
MDDQSTKVEVSLMSMSCEVRGPWNRESQKAGVKSQKAP